MSDNPLSESQLLALLDLTNTMRLAVANENWDEIQDLDLQRVCILKTVEPTIKCGESQGTQNCSHERQKLVSALEIADNQLQKTTIDLHRNLVAKGQSFQARQYAQQSYLNTCLLIQKN